MISISWHFHAWEDYLYWQKYDKRMLKRINTLIKDILRSPYDGIGKPEPLKYDWSGFWSRNIEIISPVPFFPFFHQFIIN